MGARITRAAPWGVLAASLAGCGVFGPAGLNAAVPDMLSAWALLMSAGWLGVRAVRRLAARRRWRRRGGRMIDGQHGPTVADLAAELAVARQEIADNRARLDGYDIAWEQYGEDAAPDARRRRIRDATRGA